MSEAGMLTAAGLILSVAMAFCGGVYAVIQSYQTREAKREEEAEAEQSRRIKRLEDRDKDLRWWLREQNIRTSKHDEPSPPEESLSEDSA